MKYFWSIFIGSLFCSFCPQNEIEIVTMEIQVLQAIKGFKTSMDGKIAWIKGGKTISYYAKPQELYLITNTFGEYQIYFPESNTVEIDIKEEYSSKVSYLNQMLTWNSDHLGLRDLQMEIVDVRFEDDIQISVWMPKQQNGVLSKIELVHKNDLPIYIGYHDMQDQVVRKVYFTEYTTVGAFKLPGLMSEINVLPNEDSLVVQTRYSNFKLNNNADAQLLDFSIPENATRE